MWHCKVFFCFGWPSSFHVSPRHASRWVNKMHAKLVPRLGPDSLHFGVPMKIGAKNLIQCVFVPADVPSKNRMTCCAIFVKTPMVARFGFIVFINMCLGHLWKHNLYNFVGNNCRCGLRASKSWKDRSHWLGRRNERKKNINLSSVYGMWHAICPVRLWDLFAAPPQNRQPELGQHESNEVSWNLTQCETSLKFAPSLIWPILFSKYCLKKIAMFWLRHVWKYDSGLVDLDPCKLYYVKRPQSASW